MCRCPKGHAGQCIQMPNEPDGQCGQTMLKSKFLHLFLIRKPTTGRKKAPLLKPDEIPTFPSKASHEKDSGRLDACVEATLFWGVGEEK